MDFLANGGRDKIGFDIMNTQGNERDWKYIGKSSKGKVELLDTLQWPDGSRGVKIILVYS